MAELFPSTLQQRVNSSGFASMFKSNVITNEMDVGPSKTRRRATEGVEELRINLHLKSKAEYLIFKDFFKTTLNDGTKTFFYDHPIEEIQYEFRIKGDPAFKPIGGFNFIVSMTWEAMPQ